MEIYTVLLINSCLVVLIVTPIIRQIAVSNGLLDSPSRRKIHSSAVPRVGGTGIAISIYISMVLCYALLRKDIYDLETDLAGLCAAIGIITFVGTWDDLWKLSPRWKMMGQALAVMILMPFGFVIDRISIPFTGMVEMGLLLGISITLFWLVGIINAFNIIDGMDGLAAGVTIISAVALFIISVITHQIFMAAICVILIGSAVGFLHHNFHPASIFMGDSGAMLLGLALSAVSVRVLFQSRSISHSLIAAVLIFGLPIVDTTWAIIRRFAGRRSPFQADRKHIHHMLLELGLTQRQVAFLLYSVSFLLATSGGIVALTESDIAVAIIALLITAMICAGIAVLVRLSGSLKGYSLDLDKSIRKAPTGQMPEGSTF